MHRGEFRRLTLARELRDAEEELCRQVEERDVVVAERVAATEEANQLQAVASSLRHGVADCLGRLTALKDAEQSAHIQEQAAANERRAGRNPQPAGALAQIFEHSNDRLEARISALCQENAEFRSQLLGHHEAMETQALNLVGEERQELEIFSAREARYEEQMRFYERGNFELQDECRRQGEILGAEISSATEAAWRESADLMQCQQEAAAQKQEVAIQREDLLARLESLRQNAADANSMRARLRRLVREVEARGGPIYDVHATQPGFQYMEFEKFNADQRFEAAENDELQLEFQRHEDEQAWGRQSSQLLESKRRLCQALRGAPIASAVVHAQDSVLEEEVQELRAARIQLSEVELRSEEAQQGLSNALSQLSLRQQGASGQHQVRSLSPSHCVEHRSASSSPGDNKHASASSAGFGIADSPLSQTGAQHEYRASKVMTNGTHTRTASNGNVQ